MGSSNSRMSAHISMALTSPSLGSETSRHRLRSPPRTGEARSHEGLHLPSAGEMPNPARVARTAASPQPPTHALSS